MPNCERFIDGYPCVRSEGHEGECHPGPWIAQQLEITRLRAEVEYLGRIVDAANEHEGECSTWKHLRAALESELESPDNDQNGRQP